jgi:selenocysteine-specific elongation factor
MFVVATAGHVDHGKSTLVRRLTGMEPDRWAEERRRGLTIDLGFAWTSVGAGEIAFVDVPGHERFVPNMLAGVGPAPAVMFVVAADEGWMRQSAEHLAALDALGVRHGLLVITKADRADPAPATAQALARLGETTLGGVPAVAVSGHTGEGLGRLREELSALVTRLPPPDPAADVRLWADRVFTIRGAGTVVTGTLTGGTLRVGDELTIAATGDPARVRGLQSLGKDRVEVSAVARVAVNLRGGRPPRLGRGDCLLTPGAWLRTAEIDVRLHGDDGGKLHRELVLHLGAAAVPVRVRPLGTETARLTMATALPLRVGDRGVVRDPGEHRVPAGIVVLDVRPPPLNRRGAAAARATDLAVLGGDSTADAAFLAAAQLRSRGFVRLAELRAMGLPEAGRRVGGWCVDERTWAATVERAVERFGAWRATDPVAAGLPVEAMRRQIELPAVELVRELLAGTGLEIVDGLVRWPGARLPPAVHEAVRALERMFAEEPFRAPESTELTALGLGPRELAAAERAGRLSRITDGVVLGPDAVARAAEVLAGLGQAFTVSEARRALGTTRRVAVPLLEKLHADGVTERLEDGRHRCLGKHPDGHPENGAPPPSSFFPNS